MTEKLEKEFYDNFGISSKDIIYEDIDPRVNMNDIKEWIDRNFVPAGTLVIPKIAEETEKQILLKNFKYGYATDTHIGIVGRLRELGVTNVELEKTKSNFTV